MLVTSDPFLAALFWGAVAAAVAALGALPSAERGRVPPFVIGVAYALASGLMLAGSYILMEEGLELSAVALVSGAVLGAAYSWWLHRYVEITEPGGGDALIPSEVIGYRVLLQNGLHAATEGVAIGTAFAISMKLGIFVALTLAIHNIAEGMVLSDALRARGMSLADAAGMCIVTNLPQPLLAVASLAFVTSAPGGLSVLLGVAAGSLLYLVTTELLPGSYGRAGKAPVALVLSASAAFVVMLHDVLV